VERQSIALINTCLELRRSVPVIVEGFVCCLPSVEESVELVGGLSNASSREYWACDDSK